MLGAAWKRWNWIDDGLVPLVAILMTAAWGYPLFVAFLQSPKTGVQNPGYTFGLCVVILVGGFLAGRMANENRMGSVIVVVGGMAMILVSLLLTVPSEGKAIDLWFLDLFRFVERGELTGEIVPVPLVMIVLTTVLWSRGVRVASIEHDGTVSAFVVGTVAMAGMLLVAEVLPSGNAGSLQSGSQFVRTALAGLAPLFLVTIPAAVLFTLLAPALGTWASTTGEVLLVAGILFLNLLMPFGPDPRSLLGWLLLFLSSGLAALSLVSVATTLREQERLTGIHLQMDRYWVMIMLVIVSAVLLGGLIVGQIVAPRAILRFLSVLRPIWWVVRQILLYIVLVFAYLFFSLLEPLLADLSQRPARPAPTLFSPVEPESLEELSREATELPPAFIAFMQVVLVLGLLAVIAMVFYVAIRRLEKRELAQDDIVETRETVLSADLIQEQLKGLLDALRRRRKPSFFDDLGALGDRRRVVREMYQRVLAQAIRLDAPRIRRQTPATYRSTLTGLCPDETASVDELTEVYTVARYSVDPPTLGQVEKAQAAFQRIDDALQKRTKLLRERGEWGG